MKQLILMSAFIASAVSGYAQWESGANNRIFRTDNQTGAPKEVYTLGSNPEFTYLRNLSTSGQVAAAIRRNSNRPQGRELNSMLKDLGFANGGQDVTEANVSSDYIPAGTIGNMGDGNYNSHYVKLMADGDGGNNIRAWKISSPTGRSMHILSKCGNAFSMAKPATASTACFNVPVALNNSTKDVTLENNAMKTNTETVYIYYKTKRSQKLPAEFADLREPNASTPILLSSTKTVESVPQTYRVSLSTPDNNVTVCEDKPLELTANINVEKTSSYTGYYPSKNSKYKEVSKCVYKKVARKMRKAQNKEEKVARMTGVTVKNEVAVK